MSTQTTTIVESQDSFVLSPRETRIILQTLRSNLRQLRDTSDYARWIEEGLFTESAEYGCPATSLKIGQVMKILRVLQRYCPHVQKLYQKMYARVSQMSTCSKQRSERVAATSSIPALLLKREKDLSRMRPK